MNIELKPCPFCGGEAEMVGDQYPYVECQECAVSFLSDHSYEFDFEDAASKWNARSDAGPRLKPIAESKVRQLGGDVCGVLVRKDGKTASVDEHGRVQWLQSGKGAKVIYQLKSKLGGGWDDVSKDGHDNAHESYTRRALYTHPQPEGDGWIKCSERLPTEADADIFGNVWCSGFWDNPSRGIAPIHWSDVGKGAAGDTHWKPTGLKRPQPPQEGE